MVPMQEQGSVDKLCADPLEVEAAVRFGAACGALTTTGSGAIGAQPKMEQILALIKSGVTSSSASEE